MSKFKYFTNIYWQYYKELEEEFYTTRKYVDFYPENYNTFSVEYLKLYQAVCSEIDALGKLMASTANKQFQIDDNNNNILKWWYEVQDSYKFHEELSYSNDPVGFGDVVLEFVNGTKIQPWKNFKVEKYNDKRGAIRFRHCSGCTSPQWWNDYTKVKHGRALYDGAGGNNYCRANLGNVMNSFGALFIIERAYMFHIGTKSETEAFADYSKLFEREQNPTTEEIEKILGI